MPFGRCCVNFGVGWRASQWFLSERILNLKLTSLTSKAFLILASSKDVSLEGPSIPGAHHLKFSYESTQLSSRAAKDVYMYFDETIAGKYTYSCVMRTLPWLALFTSFIWPGTQCADVGPAARAGTIECTVPRFQTLPMNHGTKVSLPSLPSAVNNIFSIGRSIF